MSQTAKSDPPISGIEALQRKLERLEAECGLLRAQLNAQEATKVASCRAEQAGQEELNTRGQQEESPFDADQEVAERRKIEAQLQKHEQRFRAIMKYAPVEIILKDTEGRYIQVSRTWENNHGHTSEEVTGKTASEIFEAEYADVFNERDRKVLDTGKTLEWEERAPHPDGTAHEFLVIRFPIADSQGEVTGLCLIATDIDERKRAEQALRESEEQLRTITDNLTVTIGYVDKDERFRFINKTGEKWYSRPAAGIIGKTVRELFDPDYYRRLKPRIETVLSGQAIQFEEANEYRDGSSRYIDVTYIPDFDDDGQTRGWFVLNQDVTDRKLAGEALRESERQIRTIADNLPVFIAYTDRDERLQFANKTVEQWYTRPAADMLGRTAKDLVSAELYAQMKPNIDTVLSGNAIRFEEIREFPDGVSRHIDVSDIPDIDEDGQTWGWFSLLQDITERKRLEAKLLQKERQEGIARLVALEKEMSDRIHTQELSRQRQEELNHISRVITINELGLSIAHEVNQPLSVISSQAQLCRDALQLGELDREQLSEWVKTIVSNAERAAEIVRRIRDYSRKQKLDFAPVDVKLAIAETLDILRSGIDSRSVTVDIRIDDPLPKAYGDHIELQQVIINLVQNALEAMADVGADRRKLNITAYRNDRNMVEIAVTDTGPGIAPDRIEDMFKPFVTTKEFGLGMGLSISSSIMESFGGRLWAVSDGKKETTFFATLPVVEQTA